MMKQTFAQCDLCSSNVVWHSIGQALQKMIDQCWKQKFHCELSKQQQNVPNLLNNFCQQIGKVIGTLCRKFFQMQCQWRKCWHLTLLLTLRPNCGRIGGHILSKKKCPQSKEATLAEHMCACEIEKIAHIFSRKGHRQWQTCAVIVVAPLVVLIIIILLMQHNNHHNVVLLVP